MTTNTLTDSAIEVAGRRLNPGVLSEWQYLLTHFELSEGFSFIVVLVPDADWAEACRIAMARYLEAEGKNLLTVAFTDHEDFKVALPGRLLQLHLGEKTGGVWLSAAVSQASPQFPEWQEAWRGMSARLNQFRNPLSRQINVPLVFVGAHWIQPVIREIAPDLWSVRTMVTRVEPPSQYPSGSTPAILPTGEEQLEGLAIDPDFALQAANQLRGKPDKSLAFAQLLYRAGRGLLARSRWQQAETTLREAVDIQRKFDVPSKVLAQSLLYLGRSLEWQYRYDEAIAVIEEARTSFLRAENLFGEANCVKSLGNIAYRRSEYDTARVHYEEAMQLYRRSGDQIGEANCIQSLADIALDRSDHHTARTRYEEALQLFRQMGSILGQANSIKGLGNIAWERSDYDTARIRYKEALQLYRKVGSVLGEANCIRSLGELARRRSDYDTARAYYEEALQLSRQVRDILGEANCIQSLGDIALARSDNSTARARYQEALQLYRQVDEILGQANCIKNLGNVALLEKNLDDARRLFSESLRLFEQSGDPYSIGMAHLALARVAETSNSRDEHLAAAEKVWTKIDRPDLMKLIEGESKVNGGG